MDSAASFFGFGGKSSTTASARGVGSAIKTAKQVEADNWLNEVSEEISSAKGTRLLNHVFLSSASVTESIIYIGNLGRPERKLSCKIATHFSLFK